MAQVHVRAAMNDLYEYRELGDIITEKTKQKIQSRFQKIVAQWNEQLNTEWVLRHYLSIKMIMSASIMLNAMDYSKEKNIRMVEPYLNYYSLLTVSRSAVFVMPEVIWNNDEIMTMTHSKIINNVSNAIGSLNKQLGIDVKDFLLTARDLRELYSYKFPASGLTSYFDDGNDYYEDLIKMCTIIAETAQFYSEQLQFCLSKIKDFNWDVNLKFLEKGFIFKGNKENFIDNEDWYRLEYFKRKQPYPVNLYWTLREGMVDDFFGAWDCLDGEDDNECFNASQNKNIIFSMP